MYKKDATTRNHNQLMKHSITLILLTVGFFISVKAQYKFLNADSVRNSFRKQPDDTAKVNRMNDFAAGVMSIEPVLAREALTDARIAAEKIKYNYGLSVSYGLESRLLFYQVKFDSGKLLLDKAYALIEKNTDKNSVIQKATLIHTYANIYHQKQQYDSALTKYLEAIALFTQVKEENKIFFSYYNISGIYNLLEDTARAMFYAKETLRMAAGSSDSNYIMRSYMAMAEAYAGEKQYDSVYATSRKGLRVARKINSVFGVGKFYSLLGTYYVEKTKQYDTAVSYYKKALELYSSIDIYYDIALIKQLLGNVYLKKGDYANAVTYLKESDELAERLKLDQVRLLTLSDLVKAEEARGNIAAGFAYLKAYTMVKDSVAIRNNRKLASELETKYQTQKKEALLAVQQSTIRQKSLVNYILTGSAVSLFIISLLSYRNYKHKQQLQQQQIAELEKEKQLLAAEAVLKGQEQERIRLAKDLHDGLGGMLSGIKYSFSNMKGNMILTPDNSLAFERSMDMLDSSIKELRLVAHNLMPESLLKFGLDTALKDFCNHITASGVLKVNYHAFGLEQLKLGDDTEVILYRIVQELINNIIKHAGAREAIVQLQLISNQLQITVEDDGNGFDTAIFNSSDGIGWSNIKSRVEYLKGTISILSEKEKGTSININIST
ncbi:MAG: sensor histidine kinase [Chitinophagaceae bacterium]|nr:sensor histidine kinase [Chitinophagaceae bacterium]